MNCCGREYTGVRNVFANCSKIYENTRMGPRVGSASVCGRECACLGVRIIPCVHGPQVILCLRVYLGELPWHLR